MALSAILPVNVSRAVEVGQSFGVGGDIVGFDQAIFDLLGQLRHRVFARLVFYMRRQRAQIFFDARFVAAFGGFQLIEQLQAARGELVHFLVLVRIDDFPALHCVPIITADVVDQGQYPFCLVGSPQNRAVCHEKQDSPEQYP